MTQSIVNQKKYQTIVFDCDGVVLNSNKIKTDAFYNVAKVYGHDPAQKLKDFHVKNGGVSRYKKFEYFLTEILAKPLDQKVLNELLQCFADEVTKSLLTCEVAEGLEEFREKTKDAKWFIVSGGDQAELRGVFAQRGLETYFDGGIFGSPDTKDVILKREISYETITKPGLFLGDSKYDYQAANKAGLDFLFMSQWTEIDDWLGWTNKHNIKTALKIADLNS